MFAMGTVIDCLLGALGGFFGLFFGPKLNKHLQESLLIVVGISLIVLGGLSVLCASLVIENGHLTTQDTMLLLVGLPLGTLIGELLHVQRVLEHLAEYIKKKSGNTKDSQFVDAFLATTCMVAIGAMGILGSIQDGLLHNYSLLIAKGIVDLILIGLMAASVGKGSLFSVFPMFFNQVIITGIAAMVGSSIPEATLNHLNLMGGILIICVGLNVGFDKKIRVMNLLPALLIALVWRW